MAERRRVIVQHGCAWRIHGPPAAHAGAPGEVGVLEVGEERGVEAADRLEHRPAVERRSCAGSEDLLDVGRRARRLPEQALVGDPELIDLDACGIDRVRPAGEADLRRDRTDVGGARARGEQLDYCALVDEAVVVDEGDPLATRPREPRGDAPRKPQVAPGVDHDPRPTDHALRLVRGLIQDDDRFGPVGDRRERGVERAEAPLELRLLAEGHDNRRDEGGHVDAS